MYIWLIHFESESESRSVVSDSATPWTIQSMEFSRSEYWSGLPFPSPGDLPNPGMESRSPALQQILYQLNHQGSPNKGEKGFKNKNRNCSLRLTPTDFRVFLLLKRLPSPPPPRPSPGGGGGGSDLQVLSRRCPWGSDPESALGPLAPHLYSLLWEPGLLQRRGGSGKAEPGPPRGRDRKAGCRDLGKLP